MTNNKQIKKTKKQHYVPQTYLKSFSIQNKKGTTDKLNVYDKKNKRFYNASISDVMEKNCFYDINIKNLLLELDNNKLRDEFQIPNEWDEQLIEHSLSLVECELKKVIDIIKDPKRHDYFKFTKIFNRIHLSQLMAIQFIRTPKGREFISDIEKELMKNKKQTQIKYSEDIKNRILLKELIYILQVFNIENIECDEEIEKHVNKYHSIYLEFFIEFNKVEIGINQSDIPLITGDNPIVYDIYEDLIYYPITPKYCIFLKKVNMPKFEEILLEEVERYSSNSDNYLEDLILVFDKAKKKYEEIKNNKNELHYNLTKEDVFKYNSMIYLNAERFIVSNVNIKEIIEEIENKYKNEDEQ